MSASRVSGQPAAGAPSVPCVCRAAACVQRSTSGIAAATPPEAAHRPCSTIGTWTNHPQHHRQHFEQGPLRTARRPAWRGTSKDLMARRSRETIKRHKQNCNISDRSAVHFIRHCESSKFKKIVIIHRILKQNISWILIPTYQETIKTVISVKFSIKSNG